MKKTFKSSILLIFIFMIMAFPRFVYAEDTYDVILFWGQSNMVGSVGNKTCSDNKIEREHVDSNLTALGADTFSEKTGISPAIVSKYKTMGHVDVPVEANTVYEYSLTENKLVPITKDTTQLGENIYVHIDDSNRPMFNGTSTDGTLSFSKSAGTNMIPWYGKTHYSNTGHKVVAVFAANGGEKINHFLPHDNNATDDSVTATNDPQYLYEGMLAKYNAAIRYLQSNNYQIGHRIDVVFQGEADCSAAQTAGSTKWDQRYSNIHSALIEDIGTEVSVIIETARTNGNAGVEGAALIHAAQEKVISEQGNIILGSSYPYDRFVGSEEKYSGKFMGTTMSYSDALKQANYSTSQQCSDNTIHFNSAALSQIGHEAALNVYNYFRNLVPPLPPEPEDPPIVITDQLLKTLSVDGVNLNVSNNSDIYNVFVDENRTEVTIASTLMDASLSFVEGYGPRKVNLEYGLNKVYLKVKLGDDVRTIELDIYRAEPEPVVVPIPDTFMGASTFPIIMGILMITGGIYFFHYSKKVTKNS